MKKSIFAGLAACVIMMMPEAWAVTYKVPTNGSRVVGKNLVTVVPEGKVSLEDIAKEYQMGFSNMTEANPRVDAYLPKPGTKVIIPQKLILPNTVHEGIVINSAEMRLYYFHDGMVEVLPIGIGQLGKDTPVNWVTKVQRKKAGPTWTPTARTRAEYAAMGEPLPAVVPAGKDNPMGLYALYVGNLYAIHGTNANFGIGLRVSHGCIRLRDADIKYLFETVPVDTRVEFINEPVKYTKEPDGSVYVEIHQPLSTTEAEINSKLHSRLVLKQEFIDFLNANDVDMTLVEAELNDRSGMPLLINPIDF